MSDHPNLTGTDVVRTLAGLAKLLGHRIGAGGILIDERTGNVADFRSEGEKLQDAIAAGDIAKVRFILEMDAAKHPGRGS